MNIDDLPAATPNLKKKLWSRLSLYWMKDFLNGNLIAGICGAAIVAYFTLSSTELQIAAARKQQNENFVEIVKQLDLQQRNAVQLQQFEHAQSIKQIELQEKYSRDQIELQLSAHKTTQDYQIANENYRLCIEQFEKKQDARTIAVTRLKERKEEITKTKDIAMFYGIGSDLMIGILAKISGQESDKGVSDSSGSYEMIKESARLLIDSVEMRSRSRLAVAQFQTELMYAAALYPENIRNSIPAVGKAVPFAKFEAAPILEFINRMDLEDPKKPTKTELEEFNQLFENKKNLMIEEESAFDEVFFQMISKMAEFNLNTSNGCSKKRF